MNGTFLNYLSHFAIALGLSVIFYFAGAGTWCILPGIFYFYGREVGEKGKQRSLIPEYNNASELTDINPFHSRWTTDDRLDLLSGILGALAILPFIL